MKKETLTEIESLLQQFRDSPFQEVEMSSGDRSISLRRQNFSPPSLSAEFGIDPESDSGEPSVTEEDQNLVIEVHRVGLFYPAVQAGDAISKGQTIGHIKAMNIKHELKSGFSGIVDEVLVEEGSGVAYGDPVVRLRDGSVAYES
jgi:biotin carboxyl carrier protein